MALEALKWDVPTDFTHQPKHDLESLFYVIITLCTYMNGPGCLRSSAPVDGERSVCLNLLWSTYDHHDLARHKAVLFTSFNDFILERLPPYWKDFHGVLNGLHAVLWPEKTGIYNQPNVATHDAFLKVLKDAQEMFAKKEEEEITFALVVEKRFGQQKRNLKEVGEDDNEENPKRTKKRVTRK